MDRIKDIIVVLIMSVVIMSWVGFAIYGMIQAWQFSDVKKEKQFRINHIEHLQEKIVNLREEVYILNSCIRWEIVFSETLSSQEKAELDVIEASLRNKIQKSFPNK